MSLTLSNFQALLPLLVTCATSVFVMLAIAIKRNHWWNATVTVLGLNAALVSIYFAYQVLPQLVTPLFVVDGFGLFFAGLILVAALGAATLTNAYMESFKRNREEIYLLLTIATSGGLVLCFAHHMASLFIGIEMMSIALYGMVAYTYDRARSLEAAIKYMVLSATASAIMLFGMALIYAHIGSLAFSEIGLKISQDLPLLIVIGGMMVVIGLFFKLSLAPFHIWTPDVYEGAPAPVGAFLATAAKVAIFAVLIRFIVLEAQNVLASNTFVMVMLVVSSLSMLVGNLLALKQNNIKRMLGYSSIAHFGYLLLLVLAGGSKFGLEGAVVYLTVYVVASLSAFGVLTLMSDAVSSRDADTLMDFRGLFWRRPYLASIFTLALFSLAGIPLTAGFIGKFYVVTAAVGAESFWGWIALAFVVLGSSIGIYFYLRTIVSLFLAKKNMFTYDAKLNWGQGTGGIMVMCSALYVLVFGIFPDRLMTLAKMVAESTFIGQ